MESGQLRHRIKILNPTISDPTVKGDVNYTYPAVTDNDLLEMWASIQPVEGRELVVARNLHSRISHKIRTRYNAKIDQLTKLAWYDGVKWIYFEVASVLNKDMKNYEFWFYAIEIQ